MENAYFFLDNPLECLDINRFGLDTLDPFAGISELAGAVFLKVL